MTTASTTGAERPGPRARGVVGRRRAAGLALALAGLPALTAALAAAREDLALGSVLLLYVLLVVLVSAVGGMVVGLLAAVGAFLLANYFLTPPFHTFIVESRDSVIALLVFLAVAAVVSVVVDLAADQRARAVRTELEAEALGRVAAEPLSGRTAEHLLAELATTFGLTSVELRDAGHPPRVVARFGPPVQGRGTLRVDAGGGRQVVGDGREPFAEDRRLLSGLAHAAGRAADAELLADEAARARQLAEVDRLRAALLAAVGHDLRTPLATIKAAVTTLRLDISLPESDRAELLASVDTSTDRLTDLVSDLLDLSRLQAGAVVIELAPVAADEVVARALIDRHLGAVDNDVPDDLPYVLADAGLLERVVANLASNAVVHAGGVVQVAGRAHDGRVDIAVVDHGPGVPAADWQRMFLPFQRLGDQPAGPHTGLGLAIARGFTEAMGGTLTPSKTTGGGLTMTVSLPGAAAGSQGGPG